MLNAVLKDINNYFYKYTNGVRNYSYTKDLTFSSNDTITGDFADTFIAGEYVRICGSRLNDGVYKISAINDTTITIDTTVDFTISDEAEISCTIEKLYIPQDLIEVVNEIKSYDANAADGIKSESQGSRSVSYMGSSGWKDVFKSKLNPYRKLRW